MVDRINFFPFNLGDIWPSFLKPPSAVNCDCWSVRIAIGTLARPANYSSQSMRLCVPALSGIFLISQVKYVNMLIQNKQLLIVRKD